MAVMKYETFVRDNVLVEFLRGHRGEGSCVSSRQIVEFLGSKGYSITQNAVHNIIMRIKYSRNLPICSRNAKGYYWAVTQKDIRNSIADLEGRVIEILNHITYLKQFLITDNEEVT